MKPTFPINESEITKKGLRTACGSVLTWVSFLPTLGAWSILEASPLVVIPMGLVTVGGLWLYWKSHLEKKRPLWIEGAVKESNVEQDAMIRNQVLHFQRQGANWEGQQLQRALQHKQAIENRLLVKKPRIALWSRMEILVDTLIFSLIDKLEVYRGKQSDRAQAEIKEALYQLAQTEENLDDIIAPHLGHEEHFLPSEDKLATALRELKEEREIAQRVKQRLESGFSETTYSSDAGVAE